MIHPSSVSPYILSAVPSFAQISSAPRFDEEMLSAVPYQHVIAVHREHFARFGVRDLRDEGEGGGQCLGVGSFGAVFAISETEVVKVTRDRDEALASHLLIGRRSAHLPLIHKVYDLPVTRLRDGWDSWYVIIRERLEPLTGLERSLMELMWRVYSGVKRLEIPQTEQMMDRWRGYLRQNVRSQVDLQRCVQMLRRVAAGQRELSAFGLRWSDMHEGNIMRRPRSTDLVIADLGYAEWTTPTVSVRMEVLLPRPPEVGLRSA